MSISSISHILISFKLRGTFTPYSQFSNVLRGTPESLESSAREIFFSILFCLISSPSVIVLPPLDFLFFLGYNNLVRCATTLRGQLCYATNNN